MNFTPLLWLLLAGAECSTDALEQGEAYFADPKTGSKFFKDRIDAWKKSASKTETVKQAWFRPFAAAVPKHPWQILVLLNTSNDQASLIPKLLKNFSKVLTSLYELEKGICVDEDEVDFVYVCGLDEIVVPVLFRAGQGEGWSEAADALTTLIARLSEKATRESSYEGVRKVDLQTIMTLDGSKDPLDAKKQILAIVDSISPNVQRGGDQTSSPSWAARTWAYMRGEQSSVQPEISPVPSSNRGSWLKLPPIQMPAWVTQRFRGTRPKTESTVEDPRERFGAINVDGWIQRLTGNYYA